VTIAERELWACALKVMHEHGNWAPAFVAQRIGALALSGDKRGVEAWVAIATKMDEVAADPTASSPS